MKKVVQVPEFEQSLKKLAQDIADQALTEQDFKAKVDAFKALAAFHIGVTRVKAKIPDEDDQETFGGIIRDIATTGRG